LSAPTLVLSPAWEAQQIYPELAQEIQLGDGYTLNNPIGLYQKEEWQVSRRGLTYADLQTLTNQLKTLEGVTAFQWSPHSDIASKLYFCEDWSATPLGPDTYEFSAKFIEDLPVPTLDYPVVSFDEPDCGGGEIIDIGDNCVPDQGS